MQSFVAADGRRLAFEDSGGAGPPVLCLAGLTRNSRDFEDLAVHLTPDYRVIRLDSRGRGASEYATDPLTEYSVSVEAGDAIALMNQLGLSRCVLIGTSRGGILSMAIAGGNPGRVSAVVLNDVGAVIEGRGLLRILSTIGREPTAETLAQAAEQLRDANSRAFTDVDLSEWERCARRLYNINGGRPVLAYDRRLRAAVAVAIESSEGAVILWPLFEALKKLPVLVVHGENSDILSMDTIEAMRAAHPTLEVVHVPNRGHAPFLNEPVALDAITRFLDRHARTVAAQHAGLPQV